MLDAYKLDDWHEVPILEKRGFIKFGMSTCYRSVCSGRQKPLSQHQLTLSATAAGGLEEGGSLLHQFEARLNSSWQATLFIKWYAVLINVVEACFAIHEMSKRKREGASTSGGGLSGFVGRNLHLVTEMVMMQSNVLAVVGLLKPHTVLLLPYLLLHVATLALELNYFITRTALGWTWHRHPPEAGSNRPVWRTLSMLAFVAFNLLIMIGAKFGIATTSDAPKG